VATEFDDKDIKNALQAWRESAEKQGERPEWFWTRQRSRIASHRNQPRLRRMPSLAWAGIAATVTLGVVLMVPGQQPRHPGQPDSHAAVKIEAEVSDHELMQQLEQTMNSGVPDALQPASALAQEMEQAYSSSNASRIKERTK